jgi:hypothetical protein
MVVRAYHDDVVGPIDEWDTGDLISVGGLKEAP